MQCRPSFELNRLARVDIYDVMAVIWPSLERHINHVNKADTMSKTQTKNKI